MKQKTPEQLAYEAENIEFELANELCPDDRGRVRETREAQHLRGILTQIAKEKLALKRSNIKVIHILPTAAPRQRRGRGEGTRSSQNSGDGNSDSDPDPARPLLITTQLLNQVTLASAFCVSKKTIQNLYSKTPWLLPPAIRVPGCRGPRWTPVAVQAWLENRPAHHSRTPAPVPEKKKVGRPRIALSVQGGAA